ncbi:hypothetical protein, partial [Rubrivivax gelatinosus]|uniref:hypothetical protein n=1 Tax=Rubrivivax gelatinosus TaxID=28068 RepID=UPI001A932F00
AKPRRRVPAARSTVRARGAALAMTFGDHLAVSVRGIACAPPGSSARRPHVHDSNGDTHA